MVTVEVMVMVVMVMRVLGFLQLRPLTLLAVDLTSVCWT